MRARFTIFIFAQTVFLTMALCAAVAGHIHAQGALAVGNFSRQEAGDPLPSGWQSLTFNNIPTHTQYDLVTDEGTTVVRAVSRQSSSGIVRKISIDPRTFPIISWRWKVMNIMEKGDVTRKSGDDYPGRIYVTFAHDPDKLTLFEKIKFETLRIIYGEYPPAATLTYIWASHEPVGTIVPNPYTDRVRMIVVRSGSELLGAWMTENRNILEDYRSAFGGDPPNISGVALMTDSDNTKSSAVAFYGDIFFSGR